VVSVEQYEINWRYLLDEDGPTEVLEVEVLGVAKVPAVLRLKLLLDVEVELVPCVAGSGSVVYGPERWSSRVRREREDLPELRWLSNLLW